MLKFNLIRDKVLSHQPQRNLIAKWLRASVVNSYSNINFSISIVDLALSQQLNLAYRGIDKATNVISLEYVSTRDQFNFLSGELILCDEIIVQEANAQHKSILAHYAHMLIHGVLHLQGYDHQAQTQAEQMEQLEIKIMHKLGFNNPHLENL